MTTGLPIRPVPAACRISTASPILLHPSLITACVSGGINTGEPWERFSVDQSIKSGRNGSGTKHLVFIAGHPYKYWPCSLTLNQPTVPVLQPPLHLSSICAGNSPVPGEFPAQRPVTRSFDVFFDLRLNIRLSKQSRAWWFETLSHPLWRHPHNAQWANNAEKVPMPWCHHTVTTRVMGRAKCCGCHEWLVPWAR